jgi:PAS domain S-box-containing protein
MESGLRSVQFYQQDETLLDALAQFAARHLALGDTIILVLAVSRAAELRGRLAGSGIDAAALEAAGRYVEIDADAALSKIVDGPQFDETAFSACIGAKVGSVVARASSGVAAFSEMSALLSTSARYEAAFGLDRAWRELCASVRAELLCVYPLDAPVWQSTGGSSQRKRSPAETSRDDSGESGAWETLRRMNLALGGEFDEDRLMQIVLDAAVELVGARRGVLVRRDDSAGPPLWLRTEATAPDAAAEALLPHADIVAATLHDRRVIRFDDLSRDAVLGSPAPPSIASYLAAPVVPRSGRVLGGIFLSHTVTGAFSGRDELLLQALAAQAALAIDNAQLRRANEHVRDEQRALTETLEQRIVERTDALYRSEQQLDQLISGIADYAIYLLDSEGRVVTWNTGAERTMGYAAEDVVGQAFTAFYTPEDREAEKPRKALAIARSKGKYETEGWRVRKDGSRFWASVLIDAIHDGNGELVGFAKVTRDMTERRAIEEQLQQSQRMEAVGRTTGGVAHDFNNLLTIILGNLDAICRESELRPKVRTAAEHALRGAQRAAALTRQLLAFSRRQPLNPKPTDINHLVAGTAELLKRTFGESTAIVTELAGDLGACEVDAPQLESALINLAMNARDAMPSGGRLTISTASVAAEDPAGASPRTSYATISITDTGVGMSPHVREHAFEPFFTTKPAGRGTGLGLSQVYGFVRQSGGHVDLRSEPGRGTTITIRLPQLGAEVPAAAEAEQVEAPLGSGTVLLVEDNEDVRRYSAGVLGELGFEVLEAADAETALDLLARRDGDVRLVFTDIHLPGMQGDELAAKLRRDWPRLKVLLTTGYAHDARTPVEGIGAPLNKPYTRAQLAESIRDLLEGKNPVAAHPRALLVEDDPLLRDLTARMLEEMQFEVEPAGSMTAALHLIEAGRRFDFALVDRMLGDGDGIVVMGALRAAQPGTPVLLTSGYDEFEASDDDAIAETLRKPYGYDALADALARLGLQSDRRAGAAGDRK